MVRVFAAWAGEEIASGTARTIAVTTAFRDGFMALLTKESCRRRGIAGVGPWCSVHNRNIRNIRRVSTGYSVMPAGEGRAAGRGGPCCGPGRAVLWAGESRAVGR